MKREWACGRAEEIEGAGYGEFRVFKEDCGPVVSYSMSAPPTVRGYQVRKVTDHCPQGKIIKHFSNIDDAIIFSGHLHTVELNLKNKDNVDTKDIHTDTGEV